MNINYFLSGFGIEEGFSRDVAENLSRDIPRRDLLLFIPSTLAHSVSEMYMATHIHWFEKAGMPFLRTTLLDDRTADADAARWIGSASCIFLMGGDTLAQIAFLKQRGWLQGIRDSQAVAVGISAGAINMGLRSLCTKDEDVPQSTMYEGIGRADITIDPHFSLSKSEVMAELRQLSHRLLIYGICDGGAAITRDDERVFLGTVYQVKDGCIDRILPPF